MVVTAGSVQEEMLIRDGAVPPCGATTSQSGPGKLLANGASGVPATGLFAETDCAAAIMVSEARMAKRYCGLFLYIDITPSVPSGEPTDETQN
jgi:hypothetical protein